MKIHKVSQGIYQFVFTKKHSEFSFNITALIDGNRAVLIDVAYECFADEAKQQLAAMGITEYVVLISHHHEDHFDGCKSFKDWPTYASSLFAEDKQAHLEPDDFLNNFSPELFLVDGQAYESENFNISFIATPGHNKCGFTFLINEKYLHVGDLFFRDPDGLSSLPYLDANSFVDEYISSLNLIRELKPECLMFGHGDHMDNQQEIETLIENSLSYLRKIQVVDLTTELSACLEGEVEDYSGIKFHENNLLRAGSGDSSSG